MQPIRCKLCGYTAILETHTPAEQVSKEDLPKVREGAQKRDQRRQQIAAYDASLDEVGAEFGDECGDYAHDYEDISWPEMSFGREVRDYLGRWPTRTEIRVAVRAAIEISERETVAISEIETPELGRGSSAIGNITRWVHLGHWRGWRESATRWREMRLEKWREIMNDRTR